MLSCCCQCFCSMQNLFVVATHYVWQTNLFQAINLLHFTRISTSHGVFTRLHECIKMAHLKGNNELLRRLDTLPSGTCIFTNVAVSNQLEWALGRWTTIIFQLRLLRLRVADRNPKFSNCKTSCCTGSSTTPAFCTTWHATSMSMFMKYHSRFHLISRSQYAERRVECQIPQWIARTFQS